MNDYTWAAFSPLIGGNPIGAEYAFGKPPEYMMNAPGFWANDSLYFNYMNNTKGLYVPYHVVGDDDVEKMHKVDVVVATCPCAGLSGLNSGKSADSRGADAKQNDHMYNSTRFVLEHVKPKVLTGENAPALFTGKGKPVADKLRDIAAEFGYSFSLYKTNTALHGIPQNRHRTFYFMWKSDTVPEMEWYDVPRDNLIDFLNKIPKGLKHSDTLVKPDLVEDARYRFVKENTENARIAIHSTGVTAQQWIDKAKRLDEFIEWCKTNGTEQDVDRALHAKKKYAAGMSIWDGSVHVHVDTFNAYVGRNAIHSLHPTEERSLTLREGMALMGMPDDFEIIDGMKNHSKLPQNVPTCTAKSMTEQVIKFMNGELKMTSHKTLKQDNERRVIMDYDTDKILQRDKPVIQLDQPTLEEYFN